MTALERSRNRLPIAPDGPALVTPPPPIERRRRVDPRRRKVLLIQPRLGFSGVFVVHMPLGPLYAAAELVARGIEVEVLDLRLHPETWREAVRAKLSDETLLVGLSVMTGQPIRHAIELGRLVKSVDPDVAVSWGGPHVTFAPDSVMDEPSCDYAISGYASRPLDQLVRALMEGRDPSTIPGVSSRRADGGFVRTPEIKEFEHIPFGQIPYHLVGDARDYGQLDDGRIVFSMYSVLGCPYQCTFCSSPAQYRGTPGKLWVKLEAVEVVDHIEYVMDRFRAGYIYFIDDDSFVSLKHVEGILDEIDRRGLKIPLGFRGARINEIKRMSDGFLSRLAAAGTDIMHVGAESGSDRILKLIKKDCTVEDILACNRKLARHPEITVGYNFMIGLPSETLAELHATRDLWLRLLDENPRAIIFTPNKFRPLPGTELFDLAVKEWNYTPPRTLEDWADIELESDTAFPWYPDGMERFCNLLFVSSYFVDDKIFRFSKGGTPFYRAIRAAVQAYGPVARWRLRHGYDQLLFEHPAYHALRKGILALQLHAPKLWERLNPPPARTG